MSILAEVSTFRGEALLNRALAAHLPGLSRGNGGIEFIASQLLAAAAVVKLFSDIAGNSEVFAPIVFGRSLETPENVLILLKDIGCVVKYAENCSGLSHADVFRSFVELSKKRSAAAQIIVERMILHRETHALASQRISVLLRQSKEARVSGQVFRLETMEDVWLVILAQQARKRGIAIGLPDELKTLGAVELIEDFAARQPGGRINAFDFAAADGASITNKMFARDIFRGTLLESLVCDLAANARNEEEKREESEEEMDDDDDEGPLIIRLRERNGKSSSNLPADDPSCNPNSHTPSSHSPTPPADRLPAKPKTMRTVLHMLLSQPQALPLFFRFLTDSFGYGVDLVEAPITIKT
jgi:hypothetical protein